MSTKETVVVETPEARVTVMEIDDAEMQRELARVNAEGCRGCGATEEQMRLVPGGVPQLGYRDGSGNSMDPRDWVIASCPLCKPAGNA